MTENNNAFVNNDDLLDWDSEITEEKGFVLLPPGDYDFTVVNFSRERYQGSEKLPACPMAVVTLRVSAADGDIQIDNRFYLLKKQEWKIGQFFLCIGLKKAGEPFKPNWSEIVGRKGRCQIGIREYKNNQYNDVKKFYEPDQTGSASAFTNENHAFSGGF